MDLRNLAEELEEVGALDKLAAPTAEAVDLFYPEGPIRNVLRGKWLGHPLHPMLTDLPIGFWTTAFVFDLLPFRGTGKAARTMIGLGTIAALPALASGWAEFAALPPRQRRAGLVHGMSNEIATTLYASSYLARRRGRTFKGVVLGMLGAGAVTFSATLGGQLVYRLGAGVSTGNDALTRSDDRFGNGLGPGDDRGIVGLTEPIAVVEAP
jgi:uncharacterized membrane protein